MKYYLKTNSLVNGKDLHKMKMARRYLLFSINLLAVFLAVKP
jgi:hypothetical protein